VVESLDNTFMSQINVYPNPVYSNEAFNIDLSFGEKKDIRISIYSLDGKLMYTKKYDEVSTKVITKSINSIGTYLILIESPNEITTTKIIIK